MKAPTHGHTRPEGSRRRTVFVATLAGWALLAPAAAFAQEVPGGEALKFLFLVIFLAVFIPAWIYGAIATQVIARKTNTANGWLAWIPFAHFFLWANIARKPVWWALLCLVPGVNLVFTILLWMAIAEVRGKPFWWGALTIVPIANSVAMGYLAWSK